MCVIIKRDPNILIPEDKIISACHVNPDGLGFSVVDRGKLETIKIHESTGNDPVKVMKLLEDAKAHQVYLHLRFTTAGKSNEENCHPFEVFKSENYEVQFMHNGTLYKFSKGKEDDHSDTWHFTEEILKPTIRAFYEVDGAGVLLNPVVKKILSEFSGSSVFTLYDNEGNDLIIENTSCKKWDGWWSSNDYSFNRNHRTASTVEANNNYWYGRDYSRDYAPTYPPLAAPAATTTSSTSTTTGASKGNLRQPVNEQTTNECKKLGYAIMQAKRNNISYAKHTPPANRLTFAEMAQLDDLEKITVLTEGDIYDLVAELPLAATALIMDLIHELYTQKQKEKAQAATVTTLYEKKAS